MKAMSQNRWSGAVFHLCACLFAAVMLSGCAAHHSASPSPDVTPSYSVPDESGVSLSGEQKAVLDNESGQIMHSVPASARPAVENQYKYFLNQGRRNVTVFSKRAEKYLAYVKQTFRQKGIPEELAYLACVESGYNPKAQSRAGAAGAWQFMTFTGMKYGLNQDQFRDERLDIFKSTEAAADYLKKLYEQFGDWPTAIAAYNAGEGKMSRACAASGENTFFGVCQRNGQLDEKTRLRPETTQYVPRFLAVSTIMDNLGPLGFSPIHPENYEPMARITLRPGTDLKAMAKACNMSWEEFSRDNPHMLKTVRHTELPCDVYVPARLSDAALAYSSNPVTVSRAQFAQSSRSERAGKAGKKNRNVEVASADGPRQYSSSGSVGRKDRAGNAYRVQANDNLWQISRKLRVSVDDLKRWNKLDGEHIHVGQTLVVAR